MSQVIKKFNHAKFPYFFSYAEKVNSKDVLHSRLVIHKFEKREMIIHISPYYKPI